MQKDRRWALRKNDGRMCIGDAQDSSSKQDACVLISIAGDLVTFEAGSPGVTHFKLLKGDTRNLSPAASAAVQTMAAALTGNTLLLKRPAEEDVVLYLQAGGVGRAKWGRGEAQAIKWLVRLDRTLCIADGDKKFAENDCAPIAMAGDGITLTMPDGSILTGRLAKGNALNL
jgi:hypothetical protein